MDEDIKGIWHCDSFGFIGDEIVATDPHGIQHRCNTRKWYKFLDDEGLLGESVRYHKLVKMGNI